jgi:hypothetical protein
MRMRITLACIAIPRGTLRLWCVVISSESLSTRYYTSCHFLGNDRGGENSPKTSIIFFLLISSNPPVYFSKFKSKRLGTKSVKSLQPQ